MPQQIDDSDPLTNSNKILGNLLKLERKGRLPNTNKAERSPRQINLETIEIKEKPQFKVCGTNIVMIKTYLLFANLS